MGAVLVNLRKAFDLIDYKLLVAKLEAYGVRDKESDGQTPESGSVRREVGMERGGERSSTGFHFRLLTLHTLYE